MSQLATPRPNAPDRFPLLEDAVFQVYHADHVHVLKCAQFKWRLADSSHQQLDTGAIKEPGETGPAQAMEEE